MLVSTVYSVPSLLPQGIPESHIPSHPSPKHSEILERAKELFYQDEIRNGNPYPNNPEESELREVGWLSVAQSELMRTISTQYGIETESETVYEKPVDFYELIDVEELQRSNVLVSGTNSTGKSRLASAICNVLQNIGWQVIVFDNTGVWKTISDIPFYYTVEPDEYFYKIPIPKTPIVYDISELIPCEQKRFADYVLRDVWNNRYNDNIQWILAVLEEAQLFARYTRNRTTQNILRIASAGRNKQIRCLFITVDLALIDASLIRLCQQRYHARIGIEENAKRKFRHYYGKRWLEITEKLETGQFVYLNQNKLELIRVPLFTPKREPRNFIEYIKPEPRKKRTIWQVLFG